MRTVKSGLAALVMLAAAPMAAKAATVEGVTLPPTLEVSGRELPLRGCGVREVFFMNIYVAGLYLPEKGMSQEAILSADTAKAVRLQIVYDGSLPQDIPESWQAPLDQMVRRDLENTIKNIYQNFQAGDQVTIEYTPGFGTTISVNGERTREREGHELISPLLRLWIGDRAVSANLRELLLSGACGGDDGWF